MVKKNKTKLALFFVAVLFLAGGALVSYWYVTKPKGSANPLQASDTTKKQAELDDVARSKSPDNKNSSSPDQTQAQTTASAATVTISSIGTSGQAVYVNALISGATSGNCKLTMTNGSAKIERTAGVGFQVSYYICQGFSLPSSEFVPKGEWNALIELTSPNGTAKSESKKVNVQ
jgi:hypothetical protein